MKNKIAVIIPYYNASSLIVKVVEKIPKGIHTLIIVNDQSKEVLPISDIELALSSDIGLIVLENQINLGVGGATKVGFQKAIELNFDIVIKVDADNQMDLDYIPELIQPLQKNKAEMAKGNRFRDLKALQRMPFIRRFGNLFLSFLIKTATGYWNNFDPTNGYFAIKVAVLREINLKNLSNRYYFETSLIAELYFVKARIKDIPMPAIYGDEKSSMSLWKMPFLFSRKLVVTFLKRILKEYFLYDFNIGSLYILLGLPFFVFGLIYGAFEWVFYASNNILAPTGTIMIIILSIILGFQLLLQAVQYDIINTPKPKK